MASNKKEVKKNVQKSDDSKTKKEIARNNNVIKLISLTIILVAIFVFCFLLGNGYFKKERKLTNNLSNLGSKFYTDFYYNSIAKGQDEKNKKEFLKQFKDAGIVVSLYNIEKYNSDGNEKSIKTLKKEECEKYTTIVTIYPKAPYKKDDYTMKVKLDCKNLK